MTWTARYFPAAAPTMLEVRRLINVGDHRSALVRLWVLASSRPSPDGDLTLNVWERKPRKEARPRRVAELFAVLDDGREIGDAHTDDPLALIRALDLLVAHGMAPRPFMDKTYEVDGREYYLFPLNLGRARETGLSRHANNPQSWFHHHRVIPARLPNGLVVQPQPSRDVTDTYLRSLREKKSVWAYLGHFNDGAALDPPPAGRFFVTGLANHDQRTDSIRRAIERASLAGADIIVFPELTVTPAQREMAKMQLRAGGHAPGLVVPGSFHEINDGRQVNRVELWGADGRELLVHHKLRPFGEAEGLAEDVHAANTVRLLVTPIGTFAVVICKDFCDDPGPIRDWEMLTVDWWLVPSMGDHKTLHAHERRATSLSEVINRAVTLLANQETAAAAGSLPGFVFNRTRTDVSVGGSLVEITIEDTLIWRVR